MSKNIPKDNKPGLLATGFILLIVGIFLATMLDGGLALQVTGVVLLVISSGLFGVLIGSSSSRKK